MGTEITPEEIKAIRGRYGLSQQSFARLLGIGEASMVRYENGQKPSKANANLIRAANHFDFVAECLERDGDVLSPAQRASVEQVVYAEITFDEEGDVMDVNEIYSLTLEQETLNEKAAEIMANVSRLLLTARREGDAVAAAAYNDVLMMLARAKESIVEEENETAEKLAEIRGRIESLGDFAMRCARRAA